MEKRTKRVLTKTDNVHFLIYQYLDELGISMPYEHATNLINRFKERKLIYSSKSNH